MNATRSAATTGKRSRSAPGHTTPRSRGSLPASPRSRSLDALVRHAVVMLVTALLTAGFWVSRLDWDPEMRLWRAVGDASILLLFAALAMTPAATFSKRVGRMLPWRRQIGIWAAVAAVAHTILVLIGWVRWDVARFLGFEFVPQLGREARMEPGFGLANIMGLVAVVMLVVLAATSTDRAVRLLGSVGWKWLHTAAYTAFYLSVLHAVYFLFLHYTLSFHKLPVPPNWFRLPLVVLGALVLALQWGAFVVSVRRRRTGRSVVA